MGNIKLNKVFYFFQGDLSFILANNYKSGLLIGYRDTPPRKIPPGTFHPGIFPQGMFPPTLLRFVARFAHVRTEDSSRNRLASTAYFAQSQTRLFPGILFMGGMFGVGNNRGGTFRGEVSGGEYSGHRNIITKKCFTDCL